MNWRNILLSLAAILTATPCMAQIVSSSAAAIAIDTVAISAVVATPIDRRVAAWAFVKTIASNPAPAFLDAAADETALFLARWPDAPENAAALFTLAGLRQKQGDDKAAMMAYLRLIYAYPESEQALQAKSAYLGLVEKRSSRRIRPALNELVSVPQSDSSVERLASLARRLSGDPGELMYEPATEFIRGFITRFAEYAALDQIVWSLAVLHERGGKPAAALIVYRELLATFPNSRLKASAQMAIGDLYAGDLRDIKAAIDAYQELINRYPRSESVLPALQKTAVLFDEKLQQYALAVEMYEKIISLFPKTDGALNAFKQEARLERDRLDKPADAVKTYQRLADQFGYPTGADALREAANVARKWLKDYALEATLHTQIATVYPDSKEAPQELYTAAQVYESDAKDTNKAIATYTEVAAKFPNSRYARKGAERAAKLGQQ